MAEQTNGRVSVLQSELAQITKTLGEVKSIAESTDRKLTVVTTEHTAVMRELWAEPEHVSRM